MASIEGRHAMAVMRFGDFRIDCDNKRLWRGDVEVELRGLPFSTLSHMLQQVAREPSQAGRLFSKSDLHRAIWRDVHVTDETIRGCIRQIRKVLDDDATQPRYLKTHNKEGWRWLMPVQQQDTTSPSAQALQPPDSPYDRCWYVERPQLERELLGCLSFPGRPSVIHGPQGSGKRTLIAHALEQLGQHVSGTMRVLRLSFRQLEAEQLVSFDSMLQAMALRLLSASCDDEEQAHQLVSSAWTRALDPRSKLKRLLRTHLLSPGQTVVAIFADVDALVAWPHQAALFDLLRSWQDDEALAELRIILTSAIPPRYFPLSEHSPLWTKAARIDTAMLSLDETRQLASRHGLTARHAEVLWHLVGGDARLVRIGMFHSALRQMDVDTLLRDCTPPRFGVFAEYLADLEQWLDRTDGAAVFAALQQADPRTGVALAAEQVWPFLRKGLARESDRRGSFVLRCPLYQQRFGRPTT